MSKLEFNLSNIILCKRECRQSFPDTTFFQAKLVRIFDELRKHKGDYKWFHGSRTAEGNFQNELAASDGHTLWLNRNFTENDPAKAVALAGHLFMHMFQWNTNAGYLHIARQRYSFRASLGEKISPGEFAQAYAYEKNAWELFLGFLQIDTPPGAVLIRG